MQKSSAPDPRSRCLAVAAVIFVVGSLVSSGRILSDARSPDHLKDHLRNSTVDVAQQSDRRFAAVKASLPPRAVIGYLGEAGALARGDYYLAEYALAPVVVDDSTRHPLVLANFPHAPLPLPPDLRLANLQLVKDFGNGVALLASRN